MPPTTWIRLYNEQKCWKIIHVSHFFFSLSSGGQEDRLEQRVSLFTVLPSPSQQDTARCLFSCFSQVGRSRDIPCQHELPLSTWPRVRTVTDSGIQSPFWSPLPDKQALESTAPETFEEAESAAERWRGWWPFGRGSSFYRKVCGPRWDLQEWLGVTITESALKNEPLAIWQGLAFKIQPVVQKQEGGNAGKQEDFLMGSYWAIPTHCCFTLRMGKTWNLLQAPK